VARQPAGKPLSARAVPQDATAVVVGTEFTLDVSDVSAMLAVSEGAVSFVRGGRSLRVDAGRSATVATDGALAYNDILLLPRDGRLVGGAWRVVEDPRAVEGKAWEALKDDKPNSLKSYVEFQFDALAGVDYHLWVRGYSLIAASEPQRTRITSDEIFISLLNGKFVNPPPNPMPEPLNEDCWLVDYFSRHQSYFWCGGSTPHGKGDSDTDYVNCVIRFSTSGTQTIRLHIIEAPMRVNAIWLSTSQRSRPEAANAGPPPNPGR
jgi:hypothetical protein